MVCSVCCAYQSRLRDDHLHAGLRIRQHRQGVAIVFMVLQFSSSGGTFPISTTGHVFQAINPYMPFTYAISLLREGVGGLLPEVAVRDALLLALFGAIALLLGLTLRKPLQGFIRRTAAKVEKSKLIS